uniref:C-type lectin domain-containing protein n=1 Tax=Panagrolaimus sp. PS1159 TaxID=55785 RepID=A0AC35FP12_9BILA
MRSFLVFAFLYFLSQAFASCPPGSLQWKDFCYFYQSNDSQIFDAEIACNALKGNLISIHDGFTNGIVASQILNFLPQNKEQSFWIGLNALNGDGNWTWTDLSPFDYNEWKLPGPQNPTLNCAALTLPEGLWIADDCSVTKPFICKVNIKNINIVATPTPTVSYSRCTAGYHYFYLTNTCYGIDSPYQNEWYDALNNCKAAGGDLASIHSPQEADFISSLNILTDACIWVGLSISSGWQWSDGSNVDYLPWDNQYPMNGDSGCIAGNKLRNFYSGDARYSVCKKAALLPQK